MQGFPYHHLLDEYPPFLPHETDTATPHTPIPIYYIHTLIQPFCSNSFCICQRREKSMVRLLRGLIEGMLLLLEAAALTTLGKATTNKITSTTQQTRTVVHADLIPGIPEDCQLYGHTWQITEKPDVKACELCHIRGYCPECTPHTPDNAQPFFCTRHTPPERTVAQ